MGRRVDEAQERAQGDALARSGFAGQAQHLAWRHVESDAVHGLELMLAGPEDDTQIAHREQSLGFRRCGLSRGGRHQRRRRKISAMPSPTRLKPTPASTMAMPGKTEIHQAVLMKFLPSAMMTPHSAVGGWAPRPR